MRRAEADFKRQLDGVCDLAILLAEDLKKLPDVLAALEAEKARLYQRLVDTQMLAHKWMEAHDKLHSGLPYEFPKPADLPDALASLEAEKRGLVEAVTAAREWCAKLPISAIRMEVAECLDAALAKVGDA
jgi:hypothetical protein